jgi:4-hydroxybutyryl-CoA dehydratase/vinylacetyl-CoA-Delta-isomerase
MQHIMATQGMTAFTFSSTGDNAMIDGTAYAQSLERMNSVVFIYGKRVESFWQHPVMKPAFNCLKETYDLAHDPAHNPALHELIVTESPLTGGRISRFLHVIQSREDLLARMKMQRSLMRHTGGCFGGRCVAGAVINALWSVTYDVDRENSGKTDYHGRFRSFLKTAQQRDLTVMGNITDAKGDRSLPPHSQADPDLFVRIVERRPDGIVINGAKLQQSGAPLAHECLVVPTTALGPEDEPYAVAFAIPGDTAGVVHVNDSACANAKFMAMKPDDIGNATFGMHQSAHVLFDHVFIPSERVFLCGEWKATRDLVHRFSDFQRFASASCRCGYIDLCIGAGLAMADFNGVAQVGHIREKLTDMSIDAETLYGLVAGSAALAGTTASGVVLPETLSVNAAKIYMNDAILKAGQRLAEIGGGILVTRPSSCDLEIPGVGDLLLKYHQGRKGVPVEDRLKMARLCESLSGLAALTPILSVIAAGPPATQRLNFRLMTDFDRDRKAAERLAGIVTPAPK